MIKTSLLPWPTLSCNSWGSLSASGPIVGLGSLRTYLSIAVAVDDRHEETLEDKKHVRCWPCVKITALVSSSDSFRKSTHYSLLMLPNPYVYIQFVWDLSLGSAEPSNWIKHAKLHKELISITLVSFMLPLKMPGYPWLVRDIYTPWMLGTANKGYNMVKRQTNFHSFKNIHWAYTMRSAWRAKDKQFNQDGQGPCSLRPCILEGNTEGWNINK